MLINKPLILSTGTGVAPAFTIDQSIRFNNPDSAYMSRTPSSAGNRRTFTISFWIKRGNPATSTGQQILNAYQNGSNRFQLFFDSSVGGGATGDKLTLFNVSGGTVTSIFETTQLFRDHSAWYHFVISIDTTNAVASERVRLYVNGSRVTDFSTQNNPSLNYDMEWNNNQSHIFGEYGGGAYHLDAYLAEIVNIDGTALDPSSFGEYNDSNIWIPKNVSGLTFGTNGFHIDGRDSADLGDDESGNGNDFTTSGLASNDQVADSPTNNFCVCNPLNKGAGVTLSEGNLKNTAANADEFYMSSSMGMNTGKWYMEGYLVSLTGGQSTLGITSNPAEDERNDYWTGQQSHSWGYAGAGSGLVNGGLTVTGTWSTFTTGDIIGVAVDLDNNLLYLYKNGTVQNSGTGVAITDPASTVSGYYFFATGDGNSLYNGSWVYNWGQEGTFAGNTTAGGNSDGNGIGNFKYSVPSGYLALCTKNLGS